MLNTRFLLGHVSLDRRILAPVLLGSALVLSACVDDSSGTEGDDSGGVSVTEESSLQNNGRGNSGNAPGRSGGSSDSDDSDDDTSSDDGSSSSGPGNSGNAPGRSGGSSDSDDSSSSDDSDSSSGSTDEEDEQQSSGDSGSTDDNQSEDSGSDDGSTDDDSNSDDDSGSEDSASDDDGSDDKVAEEEEEANAEPATLSWTAPSTRENGDPISLSQIEGYALYYRTSNGSYADPIEISDNGETSYDLDFLSEGTYYLAMRVVDTDGQWSSFSEEVQVTID